MSVVCQSVQTVVVIQVILNMAKVCHLTLLHASVPNTYAYLNGINSAVVRVITRWGQHGSRIFLFLTRSDCCGILSRWILEIELHCGVIVINISEIILMSIISLQI